MVRQEEADPFRDLLRQQQRLRELLQSSKKPNYAPRLAMKEEADPFRDTMSELQRSGCLQGNEGNEVKGLLEASAKRKDPWLSESHSQHLALARMLTTLAASRAQ